KRQRDFRHAIGAFLDLVAMNLSGGRGVPEALMAASEIGEGWAFWRIRDALANARITGQTPWQALGLLGEEVQVNELKDLADAIRYLNTFLTAHAARLRAAVAGKDRGASAVELAVITAVLVGLAVAILVIVVNFANKQGTAITNTNVPNPAGGG